MAKQIPPLYALRAFEAASRYASFSRAADDLALTQSAISHHVRNLENHFGCSLFERNGPKLKLTEQGRFLAEELKMAFKIIENSCAFLKDDRNSVRLKAPSTLTTRWLLKTLDQHNKSGNRSSVQLSSVWMDIDEIDFYSEPYDCAILLSNGNFSPDTASLKLFDEWLIPICHPEYFKSTSANLEELNNIDFLHPSPDRRDWRRWLKKVGVLDYTELERGQLFDTLDQGISAALQGLGVSVSDLVLVSYEVAQGQLYLPFNTAVSTGDGYYLVWLNGSPKENKIKELGSYLSCHIPPLPDTDIRYL